MMLCMVDFVDGLIDEVVLFNKRIGFELEVVVSCFSCRRVWVSVKSCIWLVDIWGRDVIDWFKMFVISEEDEFELLKFGIKWS